MGSAPKRSFATRLPPEVARKLEAEIAQSEKNQSEYLRELIEEYLDQEEESDSFGSVEKMLEDLE